MSYTTLASHEVIEKTIAALKLRGIEAVLVENRQQALEEVKRSLPNGAELSTGSSTTLEQIGFIDLLKSGQHPWKNLKDAIVAEKDPVQQALLRKQSVLADYFLGSVHAITEAGQLLVASGSGSQLPAYVFTSDHVIWVAGVHKIVPTLEEGMKRLQEYTWPLEDKRMKSTGAAGSVIGKLLIFEREILPTRKLKLILVNEVLGF